MLELKGVGISLDKHVILEPSNLTMEKGQIYGLIAGNGGGKTTLLRTMTGLYPLNQGEINVTDGENNPVRTRKEKNQKLFYFETSEWLDGNLSGKDYLEFVAKQWNGTPELIAEMVDFWQLGTFYKRPIKKYSLGMKQKILLALYYVSNTHYWLMDEPTIGIDVDSQKLFIDFMKQSKTRGISILFSSHQNDSMLSIADSFYVLENRRLTFQERASFVKEAQA